MSEDNNLNEVHPDLEEILVGAEEQIATDVVESVREDFTQIEQFMWDKMGDPNGDATLWGVSIQADNMADAMDRITEMDNVMTINKPDDIPTSDEGGLLGIELLGEGGDMYGLLFSMDMMKTLVKKDPVGIIVRVGGYASGKAQEENVRPSQASDASDVVVTCMCTNAAVYTIIRNAKTGESVHSQHQRIDQIEVGESKMVDALMACFMAPSILRGIADDINSDDN